MRRRLRLRQELFMISSSCAERKISGSALFLLQKRLTNAVKRYTVQFFTRVFTQYYLLIFGALYVILYSENNLLPCTSKCGFYNPTHLLRELRSESGLQTSRPGPPRLLRATDEGSVKPRAGTHLLECGFYSPHDGKAVIFFNAQCIMHNCRVL